MFGRTLRCALAVAIALALSLVVNPALASTLEVTVTARDDQVTVEGVLTDDDGRAVRQEVVEASVAGTLVGQTRTRGNGGFRLDFSGTQFGGGTHTVTVTFPGGRGAAPASATGSFTVAGQPSTPAPVPPTTAPQPVAPPAQEPSEPQVDPEPTVTAEAPPTPEGPPTASLTATGPSAAVSGERITLSGRLVTEDGSGIDGVEVTVSDPEGDVPDVYAITVGGSFEASYTVPASQPDGSLALTLEFDGAGTYEPTTTTVVVSVTYQAPEVASPTASAPASSGPDAAEPLADVATAPPVDAVDEDEGNPWLGLTIVLVVLGGLAIITAAALLLRGGFGRRPAHTDVAGLDFLDEELQSDDDFFFGGDEPTAVIDDEGTVSLGHESTQPMPTVPDSPGPRRGQD